MPKVDTAVNNDCRYYSYVVYGEAMTDGQVNKYEKVYRGFKIIKSKDNFMAAFDSYRGTSAGKAKIINIGPYDTEQVLYQEINRVRARLENQGYKEFEKNRHVFPAVLSFGKKKC